MLYRLKSSRPNMFLFICLKIHEYDKLLEIVICGTHITLYTLEGLGRSVMYTEFPKTQRQAEISKVPGYIG